MVVTDFYAIPNEANSDVDCTASSHEPSQAEVVFCRRKSSPPTTSAKSFLAASKSPFGPIRFFGDVHDVDTFQYCALDALYGMEHRLRKEVGFVIQKKGERSRSRHWGIDVVCFDGDHDGSGATYTLLCPVD